MPKVSICIPVYNREEMIKSALDSCVNQTYRDIEIVVVDNKSTDSTFSVALDYAKRDERIKVYQNSENIGGLRNFYESVLKSTGEYVVLLGSDDYLSYDFVEGRMNGVSLSPNASFWSGLMAVNEKNGDEIKTIVQYTYKGGYYSENYVYNNFFKKYLISYFALFRRDDIIEHYTFDYEDPYGFEVYKKGYGLDIITCLKIINSRKKGIYYTDKGVYNFVNHANRESEDIMKNSNASRIVNDHIYRVYLFKKFLEDINETKSALGYRNHNFLQLYYEMYKNNISTDDGRYLEYLSIADFTRNEIVYLKFKFLCYFTYRVFSYMSRRLFKKEFI